MQPNSKEIEPSALPAPTPHAEMHRLHDAGFSLIPLGAGDDGKSPLVTFEGRYRLPFGAVTDIMGRKGSSIYGVRLDNLLVVDVDTRTEAAKQYVKERFNDPAVTVRTPRGFHCYYRCGKGPVPTKVRLPDVKIDFKTGTNSYVAGPGSTRADGGQYTNGRGELLSPAKLSVFEDRAKAEKPNLPKIKSDKVPVGSRYLDFAYPKAIELAPCADSEAELAAELRAAVDFECEDPETFQDSETIKLAKWAWGKRLKGELWGGNLSAAQIHQHEFNAIMCHPDGPKKGSDAIALLYHLHHCHGANPGKRFAVATKAMSDAGIFQWTEWKIRGARNLLVDVGLLKQVKQGGGTAGVGLYQLAKLPVSGSTATVPTSVGRGLLLYSCEQSHHGEPAL